MTATNPPLPLVPFLILLLVVAGIVTLATCWLEQAPKIEEALADLNPTDTDQPPVHPNCRCAVYDQMADTGDAQEPYPLISDEEFARLHLLFLRDQGVES